jgi:hypothetical protein
VVLRVVGSKPIGHPKLKTIKGKLDWVASIPVRVGLCGPARRDEDLFNLLLLSSVIVDSTAPAQG